MTVKASQPAPGHRLHAFVDGVEVAPAQGWTLTWIEPPSAKGSPTAVSPAGIARISDGQRSILVAVEGAGSAWHVVLRGRRILVTVRTWREELLAEAEMAAGVADGPIDVKATLPGLVVAVSATEGDEVGEGEALLTIEAMKMQNEVRSPRAGRVGAISVGVGETVTTGQLLLRLE
jgi:biotin carboxyl carrier protein